MSAASPQRPVSWRWWVCGLLLFASMINYMDRQTLANVAVRITNEFKLNHEQYGNLEWVFGWAFAVGSLIFGVIADAVSVRWLYPAVLLCWSATGFATGFVQTYAGLLVCRSLLGLFESGHWPCGLRTTQRLLSPADRTMGNSVLQSGTSIGAVLTPLIVIVACINTTWQLLRAWLPKILQQGRGYAESDAHYFNSRFYVATDIGCLGAGALTLWLGRHGRSVHGARTLVFLAASILTALTTLTAFLPKGWLLLGVLLVIGMGALGVFPCYYALSQELTTKHPG